ncbi:hypothetical protein [Streptomyces sp. NPDC006274]|uniref:hypothetical protein n=1 Tax=unclassified Streptomyces TaxID=2593676 RepID=UPI0033A3AB89
MPAPTPAVGRIVHYRLSQHDSDAINRRRRDAELARKAGGADRHTGYVVHVGNSASEGDIYPAVIVRVWNETTITVNVQVLLDGNDTYWATSRAEGDGPGRWSWPERV